MQGYAKLKVLTNIAALDTSLYVVHQRMSKTGRIIIDNGNTDYL